MKYSIKKSYLLGMCLLLAIIFLACNYIITIPIAQAATIKINETDVTLIKGDTLILSISGTSKPISWKSSKPTVAFVNKNGKVKAVKNGKATITATVNSKKYSCNVVVETPKLKETEITTRIGWTEKLKMNGTNQDVLWSSFDDSIATVSEEGLVTGSDIGETKITATVGNHTYECIVKIPKPSFINESLNLGIGEIEMNKLLYESADAIYTSNNENIAIVDNYGNVTGMSE